MATSRFNAFIFIVELTILIAPVTILAMFGLPFSLFLLFQATTDNAAAVEHATSMLPLFNLIGAVGLGAFWIASLQALLRGPHLISRPLWALVLANGSIVIFGLAIERAAAFGFPLTSSWDSLRATGVLGSPTLITLLHLVIWRRLSIRANNSFKPKPLRGTA